MAIIEVNNLSKKYYLGERMSQRSILDSLKTTAKMPYRLARSLFRNEPDQREEFWALKDVSFKVEEGEVLGIIGRNGAGKSTLLKILSRIVAPTEGEVIMNGRVGSLLEVGTGFHPELTGRENIFMNGSLLGMSHAEISKHFDEIVDFSGVEKFLDTPVKFYSSGMYTRLAFSVAAHLRTEILIVDEVLAVGDTEFQKKCLDKMDSVAKTGRTILFVSHNMNAVKKLCSKAIVLDTGTIKINDSIDKAVSRYLNFGINTHSTSVTWKEGISNSNIDYFKLYSVSIIDLNGVDSNNINAEDDFIICIQFELFSNIENFRLSIRVEDNDGNIVFCSYNTDTLPPSKYITGKYVTKCLMPGNLFNNFRYYISLYAEEFPGKCLIQCPNILYFDISASNIIGTKFSKDRYGSIRPKLSWTQDYITPNKQKQNGEKP